jgi:peptidyl-prolyl cis-trans isomerase C
MENNKVLAKVGGREITQADVNFFMQSLNPQTSAQFQSEAGQKQLLDELINQELFYLDALDNNMDKDENYLKEVERVKSTLLKQFAISKVLNNLKVSDEEVESFFNENSAQFVNPKSIQASHILVEKEEEAENIIKEINDGLSFDDAAKKYSTCPSKEKGGDLGSFSRGQMVPEFEEVAFNMEHNTLSQPVKTQFGYHIIKVTGETEEKSMTLEEVKPQIEKQLLGQKQQKVYLDNVARIKENHKVETL